MYEFKILRRIENSSRKRGVTLYVECRGQTYDIEVFYSLGGMNPFSNLTEPRGVYLSVAPVRRSGGITSFTGFTGVKILLESMGRYNVKRLEELVERHLGDLSDETVQKVFNAVYNKNTAKRGVGC